MKHGLAGSGAVLPPGMQAEVGAMLDLYRDAFGADTGYQEHLLGVAALNDVRQFRLLTAELELEDARVEAAPQLFDDARADEVRAHARRLDRDPADAIEGLLRTPEGCRYAARLWGDVGTALRVVGFLGAWECRAIRRLLGLRDGQLAADGRALRILRDASLVARRGEPADAEIDWAAVDALAAAPRPPEVAEAKDRLERAIAVRRRALLSKAAKLHRHRDRFVRAAAPAAARVDPTPEGRRRARYLAEADRRRRRALEELEALRSRGAAAPRPAVRAPAPSPDADPWYEPDAEELAALVRPPEDAGALESAETVVSILPDEADDPGGLIRPIDADDHAKLNFATTPVEPAATITTPAESLRPAEPKSATATDPTSPCRNEPNEPIPAARSEPGEATPAARNEPEEATQQAGESTPEDRWKARSRRPDLKELMRKAKQARRGR